MALPRTGTAWRPGRLYCVIAGLTTVALLILAPSAFGLADTTAPEITSVSVDQATVDTAGGRATFLMDVTAVDDLSGVSETSVCAEYEGPEGGYFIGCSERRSQGTLNDGLFRIEINANKNSPSGVYELSRLWIRDRAGNERVYEQEEIVTLGFGSQVEQVGSSDSVGPEVAGFSPVSDTTVDTSAGPDQFHIDVEASDDVAVASVCVKFVGPSEGIFQGCSYAPNTGDSKDGSYAVTVNARRYSAKGAYLLTAISVADQAGHRRTYEGVELSGLGSEQSVEQVGADDTAPPEIVDVSAAPGSIDTSQEAVTVHAEVAITDDLSGYVGGCFRYRLDAQHGVQGCTGNIPLSGDIKDGVFKFQLEFPQGSKPGVYSLDSANVMDIAGNEREYERSELESLEIEDQVEQTGSGFLEDLTPPELGAISLSTTAIDTTDGPSDFSVDVAATDDSGVQWACVELAQQQWGDPGGFSFRGCAYEPFSGSPTDGTFRIDVTAPEDSPQGTYFITWVAVTDHGLHRAQFDDWDLLSAGRQEYLEVGELPAEPAATVDPPSGPGNPASQGSEPTVVSPPSTTSVIPKRTCRKGFKTKRAHGSVHCVKARKHRAKTTHRR
jgi:hypothetical protein